MGLKLGIAGPRWFTELRRPEAARWNETRWNNDGPKARREAPRRAGAKNPEPRWATNALVGGVQGLEE